MGIVLEHPSCVVKRLYDAMVEADQAHKANPTMETIAAKNRAWRLWNQAAFAPRERQLAMVRK